MRGKIVDRLLYQKTVYLLLHEPLGGLIGLSLDPLLQRGRRWRANRNIPQQLQQQELPLLAAQGRQQRVDGSELPLLQTARQIVPVRLQRLGCHRGRCMRMNWYCTQQPQQ